MIKVYKTKQKVVDILEYDGTNDDQVASFLNNHGISINYTHGEKVLSINDGEFNFIKVKKGCFIVKGDGPKIKVKENWEIKLEYEEIV